MATQTTNLGLIKPAGTDYVLVSDFNSNADTLDGAIGDLTALETTEKTSLVGAVNDVLNSASATVNVGTTTTGNPGTSASVTNSGTSKDAVFNFTIPRGDPGVSVTVGTTTTGAAGSSASVSNSGTASDPILDFTVPRGANGVGVPTGGAIGQALVKSGTSDFVTEWATLTPEGIGALPYGAVSSNLLINGGFDIWQRGTSFSSGYTADRWRIDFNGSGATRAITRQAFTVGQTAVPDNPTYYLRFAQSVAGSGGTSNALVQRIEDVSRLAGKTVTLSFYAKADSVRNITTQVDQNFGSGGSSTVYVGEVTHSLTTSWQLFTRTITLPSISGKTIGASNFSSIYFSLPLNATFTIDIANVQLNYGTVALPFVPRSYADELRLCQRYRSESETRRTYALNVYDLYNGDISYPVEARLDNPTITVLSGVAGTAGYVSEYNGSDWVDKAATIPFSTNKNASVNCGAGPLTAGRVVLFRVVQDSEL